VYHHFELREHHLGLNLKKGELKAVGARAPPRPMAVANLKKGELKGCTPCPHSSTSPLWESQEGRIERWLTGSNLLRTRGLESQEGRIERVGGGLCGRARKALRISRREN